RKLIGKPTERRGLLSLPTGAGKTRVAVEALVNAMADGAVTSPVLWVAQTEELCEQAVQCWAEVWRAVGPERSLQVSRLWGGRQAVRREDEGDQVVVATIAQLDAGCMDNNDYDWLSEAGSIVVDEAHTSITPSWTRLLRWTGVDRKPTHAPLIGLSATPFRGVSPEQTQRLVARYGGCRLDDGIFEEKVSIPLLQRQRILARVEHQILAGMENVPLDEAEREHFKTYRSIPPSVREKIGRDLDRTNRLVESVASQPGDWPVLIFAASVSHAETLAALIARRGRTAAAVSSGTDPGMRRHLISEFRSGRLQTLTNYGVLTQGFDAPSIRVLYIARPTYSPNLYLQ
ncbi:MAG: DEAD/DEAH box helicase, partial [Rhodococcus sp. (in: high G+C Gram-positive bacteria)]